MRFAFPSYRLVPASVLVIGLAGAGYAEDEKDAKELQPSPAETAVEGGEQAVPDAPQPNLFKQIGLDFKHVFTTKENLYILGAGAGATLFASRFDGSIQRSGFNSDLFDGTLSDRFFDSGAVAGGGLVQFGAAFGTYAAGKISKDPGIESLGRDLVRAQIVTQGFTEAVKLAAKRTRPDSSAQNSFPSGHTSGTFATATVLQRHFGWKVGIPAYGFAGYVAASRLSENRHYLSDVVFGATIGILVGRTVTFGIANSKFAISPMFVPGGAGVQVELVH
jgi:membrane-associated phospholipid phosphatase